MPRYLILGAGPCGLGAAFRFKEKSFHDFQVVDALGHAGGLASSYVDDQGFTWDIGGHVQFSHYEDFDRVMDLALPNGWLEHQRESWVWIKNRFVPYPFQNNLWRLDKSDQEKCIRGLEDLKARSGTPQNFGEWIDQSFGKGLAEIFMRPYNFKVWAFAPEKMSYQWIGERVATVDLEKLKSNITSKKDDVSWGPNSTFRFPKKGGTGAIWKSVAKIIGDDFFSFNKRVQKIDLDKKELIFKSGERLSYKTLLSTIPLHRLLELCGIESDTRPLFSNSHIVGIGLKGQVPDHLKTKCWMYFPESDCPFYRVTVFSNYSPENVPDASQYWSLMCETSESIDKPVDRQKIVEETVQGLLNTKLIDSKDQIASEWYYVAEPGYPTPFIGRDKWVNESLQKLEQHQIYSRGRFGVWKYEVSNQDHTFMQGFEWADAHLGLSDELTWISPSLVNADGKQARRV